MVVALAAACSDDGVAGDTDAGDTSGNSNATAASASATDSASESDPSTTTATDPTNSTDATDPTDVTATADTTDPSSSGPDPDSSTGESSGTTTDATTTDGTDSSGTTEASQCDAMGDPCAECVFESCCAEYLVCETDPDCACVLQCLLSNQGNPTTCTQDVCGLDAEPPALGVFSVCGESSPCDDACA